MYNIFGFPETIILNSEGGHYNLWYVHDQESCVAKWLKRYTDEKAKIYADRLGNNRLISQGGIRSPIYAKGLPKNKMANFIKIYLYIF